MHAVFDVRIKSEEDLSMLSDIPILGAVPSLNGPGAERGKWKCGKK